MSVSYLPGSYKSAADKEAKQEELHFFLKLQSRLNRNAEIASELGQAVYKENIVVPPIIGLNGQEQEMTRNQLQDVAVKNVATVLGGGDAASFVHRYYPTIESLEQLNGQWSSFTKGVPTNVGSPSYLHTLWRNYLSQ